MSTLLITLYLLAILYALMMLHLDDKIGFRGSLFNRDGISAAPESFPTDYVLSLENMHKYLLNTEKFALLDSLTTNKHGVLHTFVSGQQGMPKLSNICSKYEMTPLPQESPKPRIFWGTVFNGEIDVLEWSLFEMSDLIYCFVLIEANTTFSGEPKALKFPSLQHRVAAYSDKIVYATWEDYQNVTYSHEIAPEYGREEAVRNSIGDVWRALGMRDHDVAVVADVDEFVNREFLLMLKGCDAFPLSSSLAHLKQQAERNSSIYDNYVRSRCSKRAKLIGRINVFSSFIDCPQIGRYGGEGYRWFTHNTSNPIRHSGIKWYWHPDAIPGECLLRPVANMTVENLRTRGGSSRLVKFPVGWHYRNQMHAEDVLHKYRTYGHPNKSYDMGSVLEERTVDCQYRQELMHQAGLKISDMPLFLQDPARTVSLDHMFHNRSSFYSILRSKK